MFVDVREYNFSAYLVLLLADKCKHDDGGVDAVTLQVEHALPVPLTP